MNRATRPAQTSPDPDETLVPKLMPRRRQTPDAVVAIAAAGSAAAASAAAEAQR